MGDCDDNPWRDIALASLENNLTIPIVKAYLTRSSERLDWYDQSYPYFVQRFQETRRSYFEKDTWIERKAYVFAWIAKIPHGGELSPKLTFEIYKLESEFFEKKIFELSGKALKAVPLEQFLKLADKFLNDGGHWNSTLASSSKLLHFMCPSLIPIFDKTICRVLYGQDNLSFGKYEGYICALREYLRQSENEELLEYLKVKGKERHSSVLRLVDLTLYCLNSKDHQK
ncbi:DUF6308 family protein [Desulfosporosinus sp. Sb-LF]|uniref:DUF6308 family protein n=1 Tax=Desulfosporosinus sp. Sb-LF TaxID=2560027 RepID=UPI00107F853B|nr:DUF6308 family protein [Desulfosporosinus sp. Sb-LF]TGE31600.1 hypothetical protein E4K68_16235 [Desulfosporosinus sp. Sb-LF]